MDIARLGSHPLPAAPEIENTAIKPPSPGTPRETGSSEAETSVAHESSSGHVSKGPLDDPTLKALVSEKLGQGTGYSGPQIRMDRNIIHDDGDDGGDAGPSGPDAPSGDGWGVSKNEDPKSLNSNDGNIPKSGGDDDNNGPTRGVGFGLTGRPGREGDGHTTGTGGGTPAGSGGTPTGSNTSTSSSSSSSGTTGSGSTTTVHPQHK